MATKYLNFLRRYNFDKMDEKKVDKYLFYIFVILFWYKFFVARLYSMYNDVVFISMAREKGIQPMDVWLE